MNKRGLMDLIISLLPELNTVEKTYLIQTFDEEDDLLLKTKKDFEMLLKRQIRNYWDINGISEKAGRIDTICEMRSIKWVSWRGKNYPPLLREMYDPPPVIFYRGKLPNPEKPLLGMVGTRKPSPEALDETYRIAFEAGGAGISVVSGLALGIDAMSHRGNLASCTPGYAVLGSGIDQIYPSSNRPLAKRILESGGALISEYPPGAHPAKWTFPARNRIISALSRGVLIVEAPKKSGALITAAFALEQGKDLWVSSSGVKESARFDRLGTVKLAQDGAEVIYSARNILEKWNIDIAADGKDDIESVRKTRRKELISSIADFLEIEI